MKNYFYQDQWANARKAKTHVVKDQGYG